MTYRGKSRGKKPDRPTSRDDGAKRIGSYLRYLYGWDAKPVDMAPALLDAALTEIVAIDDPEKRLALLRETLDRAYAAMAEP